jgi:signal transduction histidine kinase/CheY-like chemotaxis protein
MWNKLQKTKTFSLHCGYALSELVKGCYRDCFDAVCKQHGTVLPIEEHCPSSENSRLLARLQYQRLQLESEVSQRIAIEEALRKREVELRRSADEALASKRAISTFLANVSHEIRTPLAAVVGFSEVLLDSASPEETQEGISVIYKQSKELTRLLNDILDVSKVENGHLSIELLDVDLNALFAEVYQLVSPLATSKGISVLLHTRACLETVRTDPSRLRQVLVNIIGNAIKFTSKGIVEIDWDLTDNGDGESRLLQCTVKDSGCGIAPEHMDMLFKPFGQAESCVFRQHGGTGLGLYLSMLLCRRLGGDLTLSSSTPGVGSTFLITASVERVKPSIQRGRLCLPEDKPSPPRSTEQISILVVDDNATIRLLLTRLLQRIGYARITPASSGRAALQYLDEQNFDIILLDLNMPDMDGYETCAKIHEQLDTQMSSCQPVIVACTAAAMLGEREKCISSGFDDYISKPVSVGTMTEKIAQWLRKA